MSEATLRFVRDFVGPEHDVSPDLQSARPLKSYIVCSTPRSGSGLLCRGLAGTGALGTPLEYFNPVHRGILTERWRCGPDLQSYVQALQSRRTMPDGIFGVKVHWEQMARTRAEAHGLTPDLSDHETPDELLEHIFPAPTFIRIIRQDRDSQAVSYWRALASNVWSVGVADPPGAEREKAPYDFEGIERCRQQIDTGDACWDRLIRERGEEALVVTYEDLSADFASNIERVARHVAPDAAITVPSPSTRKLSDEHSVELLDRYRAERRVCSSSASRL
jgi:LPS sulfotransferase NodH